MIISRLTIAAASTLVLAGCQYFSGSEAVAPEAPSAADAPVSVAPPQIDSNAPEETADVTEPAEACAVLDSRDWAAWINKMPGPGAAPTIHVTGKVDVRTGGYTFEWKEGPMDRSAVPALRLKLLPIIPDGMATQMITTEEVKYEAPALSTGYSRVIVSCGTLTLAEITDIMDVQ